MRSDNGDKTATKADINGLDEKIDASAKRVAMEVIKTNDRIDKLESAIAGNTDRILTALDKYTKTAEANNRAVTLHGRTLTDQAQMLQGHEKRLTSLEPKA